MILQGSRFEVEQKDGEEGGGSSKLIISGDTGWFGFNVRGWGATEKVNSIR